MLSIGHICVINYFLLLKTTCIILCVMKIRTVISLLFILVTLSGSAQDYSGTWIGFFNSYNAASVRKSVHFSLLLQQRGRAVYGIYTTGDSMSIKKADCTCRISGQLGKTNKSMLTLNKDGIIQSTVSEEICDFVNYLEIQFLQKGQQEYLTGSWFGNATNVTMAGGATGNFSVQKISDTVMVDVGSYFPKLAKMIEKSNPGDPKYAH